MIEVVDVVWCLVLVRVYGVLGIGVDDFGCRMLCCCVGMFCFLVYVCCIVGIWLFFGWVKLVCWLGCYVGDVYLVGFLWFVKLDKLELLWWVVL